METFRACVLALAAVVVPSAQATAQVEAIPAG